MFTLPNQPSTETISNCLFDESLFHELLNIASTEIGKVDCTLVGHQMSILPEDQLLFAFLLKGCSPETLVDINIRIAMGVADSEKLFGKDLGRVTVMCRGIES